MRVAIHRSRRAVMELEARLATGGDVASRLYAIWQRGLDITLS